MSRIKIKNKKPFFVSLASIPLIILSNAVLLHFAMDLNFGYWKILSLFAIDIVGMYVIGFLGGFVVDVIDEESEEKE